MLTFSSRIEEVSLPMSLICGDDALFPPLLPDATERWLRPRRRCIAWMDGRREEARLGCGNSNPQPREGTWSYRQRNHLHVTEARAGRRYLIANHGRQNRRGARRRLNIRLGE